MVGLSVALEASGAPALVISVLLLGLSATAGTASVALLRTRARPERVNGNGVLCQGGRAVPWSDVEEVRLYGRLFAARVADPTGSHWLVALAPHASSGLVESVRRAWGLAEADVQARRTLRYWSIHRTTPSAVP